MSNWIFKRGGRTRLVDWLALDAWLDSSIHDAGQDLNDRWSASSAFATRFRLTGVRRWANDLVSEGLNLGIAGCAVMLLLAIPALQKIEEGDWRAIGEYAVTFLDKNGQEIGKRGILHSDAVPLEEIPDYVIKATLATEDRRFFTHFGIDVIGTFRAILTNVQAGGVVQGGSTITQQLAKNLFLSSERSLERKVKEAFLALWLETHLTKQEILKLYLDRAYMGGGARGIEAASQYYFGKSVRDVTLAEAAVMAGLYKAPTTFAPHVNLARSRQRTAEVLDNLVEAGFMTEGQVHGARLNPAETIQQNNPDSPDWFLDFAFEETQRLLSGRGEYVVTVRTTIDLQMQKAADLAVETVLRTDPRVRKVSETALVSMQPDGAVKAIVGGRDYGRSQFSRATHRRARRQPGSSFKPYVYLAAVAREGYRPNSRVVDGPVNCGRRHSIKNYSGGYRGRMSTKLALAKSVNTVAVKLSNQVGRENIIEITEALGVAGVRPSCTMALGDYGIRLIDHVGGYATFANGGYAIRPYAILEIMNSEGEIIYDRSSDASAPPRLFTEQNISDMNEMLGDVISAGTARRAQLDFTYAAGKTGTTSSYRDAWFVGYTGALVTGVWFGNDDFKPTRRVTGGSIPAMVWKEYMTAAHTSADFPPLLGLPLHPAQQAEIERKARIRATQPQAAEPAENPDAVPELTRNLLLSLARDLRVVAGLPEPATEVDSDEEADGASQPDTEAGAPRGQDDQARAAGPERDPA